MRGNLKNAVARRVDDRKSRAHVIFAKFLDNFGAGGGLIAECAAADSPLKFRDKFFWETVRINWKRLLQPDAGHFPVARRRVLSGRDRRALAETSIGPRWWRKILERFDIREAEANEIRNLQRTRTRNVTERVASHVAVIRGIGQFANSDAIKHDPDNALKSRFVFRQNDSPARSSLSYIFVPYFGMRANVAG